MREAFTRGGSALFRVYHDNDGVFKNASLGSLFISKKGIRFEADDNSASFDTAVSNVQKVAMNNSFKRAFQQKPASFKITLKNESKDGAKYNFAPFTGHEQESQMILRFIGAISN